MWLWWRLLFVFVLLLVPLGYGWSHRGWGPPYPRSVRRRRARDDAAGYEPVDGWGVLGDLLWVVSAVALVWLVVALLLA